MDKLWVETLLQIDQFGSMLNSRNGASKEILGFSAKLSNCNNSNFLTNKIRKLDPYYACAELLWYLTMTDDTTLLQLFAPGYSRFCEDGVHAFGAYGYRWKTNGGFDQLESDFVVNQLPTLIETLIKHPESRQVIMTMWNAPDLNHALALDKKDLPCTLVHQFLLRDGYLNLVTTMRSNDVWLGMPYDVFCNTQLLKLIADIIGVEVGSYTHNVGSMHFYEKNFEKIDEILKLSWKELEIDDRIYSEHSCGTSTSYNTIEMQADRAAEFVSSVVVDNGETTAKEIINDGMTSDFIHFHSIIYDAAIVCASKFNKGFIEFITDPQLRKAVEVFDGKK